VIARRESVPSAVRADLRVHCLPLQYQICRIVTLSAIKTIALSVLFITTVMCIVPRLMTLAAKVCCILEPNGLC
jgi:hypothetical protein